MVCVNYKKKNSIHNKQNPPNNKLTKNNLHLMSEVTATISGLVGLYPYCTCNPPNHGCLGASLSMLLHPEKYKSAMKALKNKVSTKDL